MIENISMRLDIVKNHDAAGSVAHRVVTKLSVGIGQSGRGL
jgi:hypothetical protein